MINIKSGILRHNERGKYEIPGNYFFCGESIEIFKDGKWIKGRIEYSYSREDYYFVNEEEKIFIYDLDGMKARCK